MKKKKQRREIDILTTEEVAAMLGVAYRSRGPAGVRDCALLAVLYRGGLRIAEALALRPVDVELATGTVTVHRGKGCRRRLVRLDAGALALLERWVVKRGKIGLTARSPLFCTISRGSELRPGRPLHRTQVSRKLKRLAGAAGVEKRVHPHGLRHTYAVELVREGKSLPVLQRLLGHSSLATTQTYVDHLSPEEVLQSSADRPLLTVS